MYMYISRSVIVYYNTYLELGRGIDSLHDHELAWMLFRCTWNGASCVQRAKLVFMGGLLTRAVLFGS